jgi:hypothetical protein
MHHALVQIEQVRFEREVFEWFRAFEMLMEIEDDLASIDVDERDGGYNYYCFVRRLVGAGAVATILESVRLELEAQLARRGEILRQSGFTTCGAVIQRYRDIVPRPVVPSGMDRL